MRIVGGMWRGRAIEAPEGRGTRPTTDRMRESLASMVLSAKDLDISDCSVLDAFAGSGGVGLELLSRGARRCTFCDKDRRAAAVVRRNCASLGVPRGAWEVLPVDAFGIAQRAAVPGAPFDVVFLDPPYALGAQRVADLVDELANAGHLSDDCLVVYERASADKGVVPHSCELLRSKRHGGTTIELYGREPNHGA